MDFSKYVRPACFSYPERTWPQARLKGAPEWCSVDLRDGNQALPTPMGVEEKLRYFEMLCGMGFRQIEAGFPSASGIEFDFVRRLIEGGLVPQGVTLQVLTPCRAALIRRTLESVSGAGKAIVHLYCSTSPLQRRVVFRMDREEVKRIILTGVRSVLEMSADMQDELCLEFSPEHFNETEPEYSLEICEAVAGLWLPNSRGGLILNLPATVECDSPNVFADQVEWFGSHLSCRSELKLSVHTHNDMGCAVAATELALLAGADRVEGVLFGNGERTGNANIVTLAGNLISRGIDPGLELAGLPGIKREYERLTGMALGPREPYAGELVFTAFSGSHQDAIAKGQRESGTSGRWSVPYLLVDPADFGRAYEPIVRINSQSGKGGLDFVLRNDYGIALPPRMLKDFAETVQAMAENLGELLPEQIFSAFEKKYCLNQRRFLLTETRGADGARALGIVSEGELKPFDAAAGATALCGMLGGELGRELEFEIFSSDLSGCGRKLCCVSVVDRDRGDEGFGACVSADGPFAELSALVSAVNNLPQDD